MLPSLTPAPDGAAAAVHVCAEYMPFARTGGLAEAVRGIATWQARSGRPTAVIMPFFRLVKERFPEIVDTGVRHGVSIHGHVEEGGLWEWPVEEGEVRVFFVDHPEFFQRQGLYGAGGGDYPDNHRRFGFFARFAAEILPTLVPSGPVVVHAHDWHASLSLLHLRTRPETAELSRRAAGILTVHNAGYQGVFGFEAAGELELDVGDGPWAGRPLEWDGRTNFLKGGMVYADVVTTVSPNHAEELRTEQGAFGLHHFFASLGDRLTGVVNGIDQTHWNPATDPHIPAPYDADDLSGKAACKAWLQDALGLPVDPGVPLVGMAARIVQQKGFDLILASRVIHEVDSQFVFVGEGDPAYQERLATLARRHPDRIAVRFTFTEEREHRLIAGADVLLMPSLYEPCGLTQLRSQRYGTLPLVRRVGGLADTVDDEVTGFVFGPYEVDAFDEALARASARFAERNHWQAMVREAMGRDFSWPRRIREYDAIYAQALDEADVRPVR
jgi:starch synthase